MLEKRKVIIIGLIVGMLIIVLSVVGFIQQTNNSSKKNNTYTDTGSGEQIKEGNTSNQGTELSLKNAIIYPGFSKLIDRGLSPIQIQSIQSTISEYSLQQKDKFKEVSLTTDSVRHILPQGNSTTHTLTFNIKVNRSSDYYITVTYSDTEKCITKLYKADKTTLLIER